MRRTAVPAARQAAEPPLEPLGRVEKIARVADGARTRIFIGRAMANSSSVHLAQENALRPPGPRSWCGSRAERNFQTLRRTVVRLP